MKLKTDSEILGVDFGEGAIKMVRLLAEAGACKVAGFSMVGVPRKEPAGTLAEALRRALRESGAKSREIYLAMAGDKVQIRRLTFPMIPARELPEAVRWEAGNFLLTGLDRHYWDFRVLGESIGSDGTKQTVVLFAAAEKEAVDALLECVEGAGLIPLGITVVPEAYAGLAGLSFPAAETETFAVLDAGLAKTSILVFQAGVLQFSREIYLGGKNITVAMTSTITAGEKMIEMDPALAEEIKKRFGIPEAGTGEVTREGIPLNSVLSLIRPVIEKFIGELKRSLEHYSSGIAGGDRVRRLLLSGGASKTRNFDRLLAGELKLKVERITLPEEVLHSSLNGAAAALKENLPELAVALGVAFGRGQGVNLLPPRLRRRQLVKIRKMAVRLIMILVGLSLLLGYGWLRERVGGLERQRIQLYSRRQQLREAEELAVKFEGVGQFARRLTRGKVRAAGIMKELSNVTPAPVVLKTVSLNREGANLTFKGEIFPGGEPTETVLSRFIVSLEDSPFFERVRLVSTRKSVEYGSGAVDFELAAGVVVEK